MDMFLAPITANTILLEIANGFFVGIGFGLGWSIVGWPFYRWGYRAG